MLSMFFVLKLNKAVRLISKYFEVLKIYICVCIYMYVCVYIYIYTHIYNLHTVS